MTSKTKNTEGATKSHIFRFSINSRKRPDRLKTKKTKKEAVEAGDKIFLGNKCGRGHDGFRYTSSGSCVKCMDACTTLHKLGSSVTETAKSRKIKSSIDDIIEARRLKDEMDDYL